MAKKRSRSSYYGNTEEMIRRQRSGLIPGGNIYQKRKISEARHNCFWEYGDLEDKRFIYEGYINKRDPKDVSEKELKSEEYLNDWWGELRLEHKKGIYKDIMGPFTKKEKSFHFKHIEECLKEKLALLKKV